MVYRWLLFLLIVGGIPSNGFANDTKSAEMCRKLVLLQPVDNRLSDFSYRLNGGVTICECNGPPGQWMSCWIDTNVLSQSRQPRQAR